MGLTGRSHDRVRDFVKIAFPELGIELNFIGKVADEKAYVVSCANPEFPLEKGKEVLVVDLKYFRPTEVDLLIGDATKENTKLGWILESDFEDKERQMVQANLKHMLRDKYLKGEVLRPLIILNKRRNVLTGINRYENEN